jgi:hypothetical protein
MTAVKRRSAEMRGHEGERLIDDIATAAASQHEHAERGHPGCLG